MTVMAHHLSIQVCKATEVQKGVRISISKMQWRAKSEKNIILSKVVRKVLAIVYNRNENFKIICKFVETIFFGVIYNVTMTMIAIAHTTCIIYYTCLQLRDTILEQIAGHLLLPWEPDVNI